MAFSLSRFSFLRNSLGGARRWALTAIFGMDIHPTARMSLSAKFDMTFPKGVHIGQHAYVAFGARILTHDFTRGLYLHTQIGRNCFIGGGSVIMPGVSIGEGCVIGAGSVVTKDVPAGSLVAGNPARVIRSGIEVGRFGRFADADYNERSIREDDPEAAALPNRLPDG